MSEPQILEYISDMTRQMQGLIAHKRPFLAYLLSLVIAEAERRLP